MTVDQAIEGFLSATGAPSAKFPTPGTVVKGTVVSAEMAQQTDMDGSPKVWNDGKPRMQIVVTLLTEERDASIDDDDGTRRVFAKGGMLTALREALRNAGTKNIEVGGTLAIKYTEDGEPTQRGFNPPKKYQAQYRLPALEVQGVSEDELL